MPGIKHGTKRKDGLYYEEFVIGATFTTSSHVISSQDVSTFSKLTTDQNPIHQDVVAMTHHPLGKPIVHGMLVASIGVGLISHLGLTKGTLVAMLEQEIRYKSPVYVGDTVHGKMEVIDKRETKHPSRGIVSYRYEILNDAGVVVVEGKNTNMVFLKNGEKK